MTHSELVKLIKDGATKHGIKPSHFCFKALNDGKSWDRIESGGTVTLRSLEKLKAFADSEVAGK